jgi:hypothetical protein
MVLPYAVPFQCDPSDDSTVHERIGHLDEASDVGTAPVVDPAVSLAAWWNSD